MGETEDDLLAERRVRWAENDVLHVDDAAFHVRFGGEIPPRELLSLPHVTKPRRMVEAYLDLLARLRPRPRRIVELGIYEGGSTALLAHLLRPDRIVAVDLAADRADALDRFSADHGYDDVVRAHYGVDQADRPALERVLDEDLGDAAPDLIIDDASHLLAETRASFEVLFPRLAPGGHYIIEDWAWGLYLFARPPTSPSPAVVLFKMLLALPYQHTHVAEMTVTMDLAIIRKADEPCSPDPIRMDDAYAPYARRMVEAAEAAAAP